MQKKAKSAESKKAYLITLQRERLKYSIKLFISRFIAGLCIALCVYLECIRFAERR